MENIQDLIISARECDRCYGGQRIYVPLPDPNNSLEKAKIMFINERPGRIGTGESGYVSFDNDDPSANFFKECFSLIGISREKIYITNACLCHPDFPGYTDTAPKLKEVKNCHYWLEKQIEIVQPEIIVTVGRVALESVLRYMYMWPLNGRPKFLDMVGQPVPNTYPIVFPVAHTSRLGRVNRKAEQQRQDWLKIRSLLEDKI